MMLANWNTETTSRVCLRCDAVYQAPASRLRVWEGSGCPVCGYVGWKEYALPSCGRIASTLSRFVATCLVLVATVVLAAPAHAAGGRYVFAGGTPGQQDQVTAALRASAFDWSLVERQITIHIVPSLRVSHSTPGDVWLDARLLDSGRFSWGVVQMEYAQQVQFFLVGAAAHPRLTALLRGQQWCYENTSLPPGANACERFAATLAWAYWPTRQNCLQPAGGDSWSGSLRAPAFRRLLTELIGAPDPL